MLNDRKNLAAAVVCVTVMIGLLIPIAQMLARHTDQALDQKQTAISRALEMESERISPQRCEILPIMDMEQIWAIEDEREETDAQLVFGMIGDSGEAGYDAQSRTFYYTLGMENGSEWPEIRLSAYGEEGVQLVWVDDYSYDWCSDAIAEGYRYEVLAYTDTQYAYIGVVFTGLPIVTLQVQEKIDYDYDTPGRMTVASAEHESVDTAMIVHQRGGRAKKPIEKWSFRVETYMLGLNGKAERREKPLLGLKPDSEWLLLSNAQDPSFINSSILYDIWEELHEGEPALMAMDSEIVEVFINNEYQGLYQLMERVKPEEEIASAGGNIYTDCTLRGIAPWNKSDKPVWDLLKEGMDYLLEYRYAYNQDVERAFELAEDYVILNQEEGDRRLSDEEFTALVLERVDIENMMKYIFFVHACTLPDNIGNNVYLYIMQQEDGRYVYRHAPWDLDSGFWVPKESDPHNVMRWPDMNMVLPTRMLELNVGNCREIFWSLWNKFRPTILAPEPLSARLGEMEAWINASGAYLRESEKWYGHAEKLNMSPELYYNEECNGLLRLTMQHVWPVEGMTLAE